MFHSVAPVPTRGPLKGVQPKVKVKSVAVGNLPVTMSSGRLPSVTRAGAGGKKIRSTGLHGTWMVRLADTVGYG